MTMYATSRTNYINVLKINICTNLTLNIYFNICEVLYKNYIVENKLLTNKIMINKC